MSKKKDIVSAKDLAKRLAANIAPKKKKSTVEWILDNNLKTEDGKPFDFKKRKFLIDPLNDLSKEQVWSASAQLGKTIGIYVKTLKLGLEDNVNVIISEPTMQLQQDLVKSKLHRLINQNPIFRDNVSGDMTQKAVGDSVLFLTWTFGAAGGIGVTADIYAADEVARSNPEMVSMYKSRLLNSELAYTWYISNPNMPYDLLDSKFRESDMKSWSVRCPYCNKRQILNFNGIYGFKGNVCLEREEYVCQYCDRVWADPDIRINGDWVKRFDNRDISGYWMNQLQRYNYSAKELIKESKGNQQYFHNMVLGLPYAGSDISVNASLIKKNLTEPFKPSIGVVAGIDIGNATGHHVTLMQNNKVFKLLKARDFAEIEEILIKYNVEMCTMDYMPEYEGAKTIQSHFPNIVWRCRYLPNRTTKDEIINYEAEKGMVHVVKHIMFDNIINDLNDGKYQFGFSSNDKTLNEFCDQFSTLSKTTELDSAGNPTFKWECPEGQHDHYAHSFLYACVAQETLNLLRPVHTMYSTDNNEQQSISHDDVKDIFSEKESKDWLSL
jgi:hypothetical protein